MIVCGYGNINNIQQLSKRIYTKMLRELVFQKLPSYIAFPTPPPYKISLSALFQASEARPLEDAQTPRNIDQCPCCGMCKTPFEKEPGPR